jgi:hypothetical protein
MRSLLVDDPILELDRSRIVRPDLRTETILQWRNYSTAICVVFRICRSDDEKVDWQANLESANLHILLFQDIKQANLDPFCQIREFVEIENAAVGAWNQAEGNDFLVAEIAPLCDLDRIDLSDQVRHGGVRRCQLFRITTIARHPVDGRCIPHLGNHRLAGIRYRSQWIVVDLGMRHDRYPRIEQLREAPGDPRFCLSAFTKQDDVMAGQDRVLQLRDHRVLIAVNPLEQGTVALELSDEVAAQLVAHAAGSVA